MTASRPDNANALAAYDVRPRLYPLASDRAGTSLKAGTRTLHPTGYRRGMAALAAVRVLVLSLAVGGAWSRLLLKAWRSTSRTVTAGVAETWGVDCLA